MKSGKSGTDLQAYQPSCAACRHWLEETEPGDDERSGLCKRGPPAVLYDVEHGAFSIWPTTGWLDKCGEFVSVN